MHENLARGEVFGGQRSGSRPVVTPAYRVHTRSPMDPSLGGHYPRSPSRLFHRTSATVGEPGPSVVVIMLDLV